MAIAQIYAQARKTPDKTAVVHNGVVLSYAHFARWIEGCRRYLAAQDLPAGSLAAICTDNLLEGWVQLLALRAAGLSTIAVRNAEHIRSLRLRNLGVVVTAATQDPEEVDRLAADLRCGHVRVPAGLRAEAAAGEIPADPEIAANGSGHILLTSGTTGGSKKVFRDGALDALAMPQRAMAYGITEQSVVYVMNFPIWTAGGYRWSLSTWTMGATVVIHQQRDLHQPLFRHSMTHIFAIPAMLYALMAASKGVVRRNDSTRLLVTGGAMSKAVWTAARQRLTRDVSSVLASTEAQIVAITPIAHADDLHWHRVDPAVEVQVVDDNDRVLAAGQEGVVRIRIDDGLDGYLDDPAATRAFFRDGYFYPGDVGVFSFDGRLSLRGRVSDVVNVLGTKVATGGIEQALQDRLGVEGVCILTIENDNGDAEMHLMIESSRPLGRTEIEPAADAELGPLKRVPVHIDVVASMPRNDMGKIDRRALMAEFRSRKPLPPPGR